jgi:hypothetical protein
MPRFFLLHPTASFDCRSRIFQSQQQRAKRICCILLRFQRVSSFNPCVVLAAVSAQILSFIICGRERPQLRNSMVTCMQYIPNPSDSGMVPLYKAFEVRSCLKSPISGARLAVGCIRTCLAMINSNCVLFSLQSICATSAQCVALITQCEAGMASVTHVGFLASSSCR